MADALDYLAGFGNEHQSEALPGALPVGRFSPQRPALGLYAEQLSSTAFTVPRALNRRTWLYRIRPSVMHGDFRPMKSGLVCTSPLDQGDPLPAQMRWDPIEVPEEPTDFLDGLVTMAVNGNAAHQTGIGAHVYRATKSMGRRYLYDADG